MLAHTQVFSSAKGRMKEMRVERNHGFECQFRCSFNSEAWYGMKRRRNMSEKSREKSQVAQKLCLN
jgi:hypothetical protein